VWFNRKRGVMRACVGVLWDCRTPVPETALDFLEQHDDNRYGGHCEGRWDGASYFSHDGAGPDYDWHMALLRPMLEAVGEVPSGFDGWWGFPR
jgi:hypothetical protein